MNRIAALVFAFGLAGCLAGCNVGPNTRVNSYTPFGQFQPGESDRVSREYAASLAAPPPSWDVTILNSSLPPGMAMVNGQLVVSPDAPYDVLGRFEIGFRLDSSAPTQSDLPGFLKRFAKAAKADLLVVEIQQRQDRPEKVAFVSGIALHTKKGAEGALKPKPDQASAPGTKL